MEQHTNFNIDGPPQSSTDENRDRRVRAHDTRRGFIANARSTDELEWAIFRNTGDAVARQTLIERNLYLVSLVVRRMPTSLARHWSTDDLESFGTLGLIDAVDRHRNHAVERPFAPYALSRIRGAIYDEFRRLDWLPRTLRQQVIEYRETEDWLRASVGHSPSRREVLFEMGVSDTRHAKSVEATLSSSQLNSLEASSGNGETSHMELLTSQSSPEDVTVAGFDLDELRIEISKLPERERTILALRYLANLTQKQVGAQLGISNSRIAQLEGKALLKLRIRLSRNSAA